MSGTENRRMRHRPLLVASVAASVLLAGGGGVYLATAASSEGDARPSGAAAPPPLRLDGKSGAAGTGGTDGGPGIAPGEPDPNGGRAVYKAEGPLPDGPSSAAVHRPEGRVTAAEVTRLAKALGIAGAPRLEGEVWKIAPEKDGSGLRLDVAAEAPGSWTFSRYDGGPAGDTCLKGKACPPPGEVKPPSGGPVSEAAARAAATPVLKAIGQEDAKLDTGQLMGSVRVVNADPVVGGLPTYGWSTGLHVGPGGELVAGSGQLKEPAKGAVYPVIGAEKALEELNKASAGPGSIGIGGCATAPPAGTEDGSDAPSTTCKPETEPKELAVTGAVLGLASQFVDGERALVPSWLFQVEAEPGAKPHTVATTAVAPEHLAPPAKPSPTPTPTPDPDRGTEPVRQLQSYRVDGTGTKLSVTFWGGVCNEYTATAAESADKVTVRVTEKPMDPGRACIAIAVEVTRTVTLQQPLGGRTVVDAPSGEPVPRT
ncbi:hypothetical protein M5362_19425 [Streptomyces sp. Je 1-79]|uniref:hypothetical protein n=1 Tax=Streptomyces sp. Je 1-79 TaxID=2943847 RepID=UPI0021A8F6EB|nr:hypothetical protein [Streptomyces sp. Je 1-79]MCT4355308.1 hypothetical protein [Streptomyces sp. Je 1-79]